MRAVLDTNVLVSSILSDSTCRRLLEQAIAGRMKLLISPETSREFLDVLSRPKFRLGPGQAELILAQDVLPFAEIVQSDSFKLKFACRDPRDDKFLRCAALGNAKVLVTGDQDLLALKDKTSFEILTAAQTLKSLSQ